MIDCNTTSKYSTHFLAPIELIKEARDKFNIPSENWPFPTVYKLGTPRDKYYAEIWEDGMDWQNSYWIIETDNYADPACIPLVMFDDHENLNKFHSHDLQQLFQAIMYYRRDTLWIKQNDLGIFSDSVWPYLKKEGSENKGLIKFTFEHASQPKTEFWLNPDFVPESK